MEHKDAWHTLGTKLHNVDTAREALEQSNLTGWNVRKVQTVGLLEDGTTVPVPGKYVVVRDHPVLGIPQAVGESVSGAYAVFQNEELCPMLDLLADEAGASFETAGEIDNGGKVFVSMKLPYSIKVGGVDEIEFYLTALTSHDGTLATTLMISPVRVVNKVMLNMEFGGKSNQLRIRHTKNVSSRVENQVEEILDFVYDFTDAFQEEASALFGRKVTHREFHAALTEGMGAKKNAPASTRTRSENRIDTIVELMDGYLNPSDMSGTAWSALSAMVEWGEHYSEVRGHADPILGRAMKSVLDQGFKNNFKNILKKGLQL